MDLSYPFHVQLHLTDKCNLKCRHCYEGERKTVNEWEYKELLVVIDELDKTFEKWNVDGEISLVGGEPVMYPYLSDLLYYIILYKKEKLYFSNSDFNKWHLYSG